jgi:RNA polymerase sigma-70 factor (ECF subfamily)
VQQESPRLLAYAKRLTGDHDAAEDLVQETWVQAFRKRASFTGSGSLFGWLLTICRSLHLSAHRTAARRRELKISRFEEYSDEIGKCDPLLVMEDAAVKGKIAEALGDLPPKQREVIILRILHDLSTRETAARLGIAQGTVKATLHQAISHMRTLLEEPQR